MLLKEQIQNIEKQIENPTIGLPEEIFQFVSSIVPMVNVDLLVRDKQGRILLARRDDKFEGAVWHIPGGIVRFQETFLHRVEQVALAEIGQKVFTNGIPVEINEIFSDHRERGHFISLLYECELQKELLLEDKKEWKDGELKWFEACPYDFISCQKKIYQKYFRNNE